MKLTSMRLTSWNRSLPGLIVLCVLGCNKSDRPPTPPVTASPSTEGGKPGGAHAPHWAELLLGQPSKKIDSAGFKSLGSCIEQVERSLPPELGVVLPD